MVQAICLERVVCKLWYTFSMKASSVFAGFIYGLVSMVVIPLVLVWLNSYLEWQQFSNASLQSLGAFSVITGVLLGVYAVGLFARHGDGGSPLPFDPPKQLVTVGVYKYIRNPMFTASAMVWFGEYLFFGSILLLPYALAWVLFNHIHLVLQDEKWLEQRYGKKYQEYVKTTTRYIPNLF